MIKYNVRSRQIIDLMNEIKGGKLILAPYFQRKLVWRKIHKIDFIKTILMGFPFPEIFIANGDIDIEKMTNTSRVVDGQQRLNSIDEFIKNKFDVDGKFYSSLSADEKAEFLKYEVAVIDLDIRHDDPDIQEIFKRLNRTFYALSNIEKISSEYGASEFMLVAKLLAKELPSYFYSDDIDDMNENTEIEFDPNMSPDFISWAKSKNVSKFNELITGDSIFSGYELSRQVHLNYVLNILGTIESGIYNRNIDKEVLEQFAENYVQKDIIVEKLQKVASFILKMKLKKSSYWNNKANMFTLIIVIFNNFEKFVMFGELEFKKKLEEFELNLPIEYQIAAKEGVNNKKERTLRNDYLLTLLRE